MIKTVTSICFSHQGLINPEALNYIRYNEDIKEIVFFGDGTMESLFHISEFQDEVLKLPRIERIGIGRTPQYKLQVKRSDGTLSRPHFVDNDITKDKWLCSHIARPHVQISLSDITSQSVTQTQIDAKVTETICYLAYRLWDLLKIVEERLGFPAMVIDKMTRWTYNLTPETLDIALLQKETGLSTLAYNGLSDLLSIEVGGDIHIVKLSVLNEIYGSLILPRFNELYGRRLRLSVAITGPSGHTSDATDMSYGELGKIIDEMKMFMVEQKIDQEHPMDPIDLVYFAKKVRINDTTCIWVEDGETLDSTISKNAGSLLYGNLPDHKGNSEHLVSDASHTDSEETPSSEG